MYTQYRCVCNPNDGPFPHASGVPKRLDQISELEVRHRIITGFIQIEFSIRIIAEIVIKKPPIRIWFVLVHGV